MQACEVTRSVKDQRDWVNRRMLTVAIASSDLNSSAQFLAVLQQTGLVKSIRQWSIPADKLPDSGETPPDVIFLDLSRDPEQFFAFAAHVRRLRPSVKVVAISQVAPPSHQLLLDAMRSGVQDFLSKPVNLDSLTEILGRFAQDLDMKERPSLDKLIVVMGSKGGVGATTVAVNLGVQLATFAKKRVVLLDFAQPLGNVHLLLNLHPRFSVRDAAENMDRLDSHFFDGLLTQHKSKLEILGGITQPEEWQRISVAPLERVDGSNGPDRGGSYRTRVVDAGTAAVGTEGIGNRARASPGHHKPMAPRRRRGFEERSEEYQSPNLCVPSERFS